MLITELRDKAAPVLRAHGIVRASVFGSTARQQETPESDVDLLVSFGRPTGMIGYMQLVLDLEDALGRPVDVVTESSLDKAIEPYVRQDAVSIL